MLKNSLSDLYFSMTSSDIEESNQVSRTLSSPSHVVLGKSFTVPRVSFVSVSITSESCGGCCLNGST